MDDAISGTLVYGNIFFHAAQGFGGVNINGGRDNIIDNNIFAECEKAITGDYDAKNERWKLLGKHPAFIMSELYVKRYLGLLRVQEPPALNSAWRNVFWKCGPLFTTYDQPAADKFDLMANADYATGDPGFVDAAKGDFRLKPDAESSAASPSIRFPWRRSASTRINTAPRGPWTRARARRVGATDHRSSNPKMGGQTTKQQSHKVVR